MGFLAPACLPAWWEVYRKHTYVLDCFCFVEFVAVANSVPETNLLAFFPPSLQVQQVGPAWPVSLAASA